MIGQATPAAAQTNSADDIIVSARKHEEESLRAPVIATVIGADELENRQVPDQYGVAALNWNHGTFIS